MTQSAGVVSDPVAFLESLLRSSGECIKVLDIDGNLIFMTDGGQRIMEVTDFSTIKGCPWPDFWQGQGNIDAKAAVEAARAGGVGHFEGFARTMAGTPKWWDVRVTPIFGANGRPEKLLSVSRDITAAHFASARLEDSERQLRLALNAGRLGHWTLDLTSGELWASDTCKENFGREPSAEFTNEDLRDAVHPDDRARAVAAIERTIETGEDYKVEYRIIRPDGTTGWVMIRGRLIRNSDGRSAAISGVSLDIGQLKETEAALIESEARFKTFAQAMPNQVWSATPDGLLDWFNEQVLSYSGLTFNDLMGTGWAQMVHPADIGAASSAWEKALTEVIPYQTEFRLRRSDGVWRWHIARALPIKDKSGALTRWIGTNTDIDDQKAVAAQLAESEQRASAAIDAADIGIWDFDPRTGALTWDKRCYELFGLTAGKPLSFETFLVGLHPDDRDDTEKACVEAMRPDGARTYDIEYRTIGLDDGVERWVSAKGRADVDNGEVRSVYRDRSRHQQTKAGSGTSGASGARTRTPDGEHDGNGASYRNADVSHGCY